MTGGNLGRRRGRRRFKAMWRLHGPNGRSNGRLGRGRRRSRLRVRRRLLAVIRSRIVRRIAYGVAGTVGIAVLLVGALWWRLSTGPIEMNFVTPWIASAIEENFGRTHKVEIGGTQIERDEHGRAALRIRDIVVRDADGIIVASAPKAEVALSGTSLLSGHIRAASLNLVGAEMKLRIEEDGDITVFAGAETRPIATAPAPPLPAKKEQAEKPAAADPTAPAATAPAAHATSAAQRSGYEELAALLSWIDGLGASGLDGYDLTQLGLKGGNLIVDDRRNGKRWTFSRINLSLTRPTGGGVEFRLGSESAERPWQIRAAVAPTVDNHRIVALDAHKVSSKDLLLALRLGEGTFEADLLLSMSIRGEIAADGTPQVAEGNVLAESGYIADLDEQPPTRVDIDRVALSFSWDADRRAFIMPFRIVASDNQIAMVAQVQAEPGQSGIWHFDIDRTPMIDPVILGTVAAGGPEPLSLNRAVLRAKLDVNKRRFDLEQLDLGRVDPRPAHNLGIAMSGFVDYSGPETRISLGLAGTRMSVDSALRIWPVFVAPRVREWSEQRLSGGQIDRMLIAMNTPTPMLSSHGPPMSDEALQVEVDTSGISIRPVDGLPAIRDADVNIRVTGGTATMTLGRGTMEVSPGRKLNIANGVFEIPDTHPKEPQARARFRVDGTLPAAAELLTLDPLRDNGVPIDPAASRGAIAAQVQLSLPLAKTLPKSAINYNVTADVTNFSVDKLISGQKVEGSSMKLTITPQGFQSRGDVKINGIPALLEYRKPVGTQEGEMRLAVSLDDAARARLGFDLGPAVTGTIPVRMAAKVGPGLQEVRYGADADLTNVKIDNLVPGWLKPAGKAARATFTFATDKDGLHVDDIVVDGQGLTMRGELDVDTDGDIVSANFPVLALNEGDKLSLKADRTGDGPLRVILRGDVVDGRGFIKSSMSSSVLETKAKRKPADFDVDVKIAAVLGHNGEALRGLELKLSRRSGQIRNFAMNAKIGRDTPFFGDMRRRLANGKPSIYLETSDAGALFRFTDVYPRMYGGRISIGLDPPTPDGAAQDGIISVNNFQIRGEPALDQVVSRAPNGQRGSVEFQQARAEFVKAPGRMLVKNGVVRGPVIGATIEGNIDYARDEIHMRGTFIPLYGLNNMFGQIPLIGFFLGGPNSNEGLLGVTYEITGQPGNFRIQPNPLSVIAPGLLRKFFEFRDTTQPAFADPNR